MLNDQLVSVFTYKDASALPDLGVSPHPTVPSFSTDKEGVRKLLANIKPHTASSPDNLPAYLLKEAAEELAPVFCLLFNATLHTMYFVFCSMPLSTREKFLMNGKQ